MRIVTTAARLLAAVALLSAGASAANVTITTGSTYGPAAPTTTYSAPNATWTLSFQVASQPAVSGTTVNTFTTTYTNGVFTLNGTPITLTGSTVTFTSFSGFRIFLGSAILIDDTEGTSMFTGALTSPTMSPGMYPFSVYQLLPYGLPAFPTIISATVTISAPASAPTATPLPSSLAIVSIGLAGLALLAMLRHKQSAA